MSELKANEGKKECMEVDGVSYLRLPIKTCVVTAEHNIVAVSYTHLYIISARFSISIPVK